MEIWRKVDIEGIYNYEISDLGRIKSLPKSVKYSDGRIRRYSELIMKPRIDGKGYYFITLYGDDIKPIQIRIHQLVGRFFIENPENKPCINHKDGNRLNNKKPNLEWATYSENTLDGIKRGTICNPNRKIDLQTVLKIREEYYLKNIFQKELGLKYNLGQAQISRIINNKNWK